MNLQTLHIQTMLLSPVTPSGPHSPQHLLTTAIHTHTHTYTAVKSEPAQHRYMHCSKSNFRLCPHTICCQGFFFFFGGGERKATCMLYILGRPASVTRHTEEPQRERTGAPCASLRLWGGGHRRLRGCNMSPAPVRHMPQSSTPLHMSNSTGFVVPSLLTMVAGARTMEGLSRVLLEHDGTCPQRTLRFIIRTQ